MKERDVLMKKYTEYLIVALCIAQTISIFSIKNLQFEVLELKNMLNYVHSTLATNMDSIYYNIDDTLKKATNLIEDASVEIGEVNTKDATVSIKFTIIPKDVTEDTEISLDFGDEIIFMERNGVNFSAEISRGFFDDAFPQIIIDENGIKKITQDDRSSIYSVKEWMFPTMWPFLTSSGQSHSEGKSYREYAGLQINFEKASSKVEFTSVCLVSKVDDQIVLERTIPIETLFENYCKIDEKIELDLNQVLITTVIATDSLGFEHWYTVDHFIAGESIQREPWFDDRMIYSPSGDLVWEFES